MSTPALETVGLVKRFGALVVADHVDFRLEAGARHALIGPNGAGKTTFVNLVTGRLAPSQGRVLLGGQDVTRYSQPQRARLGLARTFQINTQFTGLCVLENVVLAISERERIAWRMIRPAGRQRAILEEAHAVLEGLDLAAVAHRRVAELAYGQQRLVEVAIALALKPRVLLLDEPAAGVPEGQSGAILQALQRLPSEISILIIEHDMDIVFRFARRITVLGQGRIVADGTPGEVAADAQVQAIYFGKRVRALHG
jgi:branched-chain amino acid transport system ATP-binding protein